MLQHFKTYSKQDILALTKLRQFETKLGEQVQVIKSLSDLESELKNSKAKFVLFGIPEDIGVRANGGLGGADSCWLPFLQSFLNIQSNLFLDGQEIIVLGHFDFSDLVKLIES